MFSPAPMGFGKAHNPHQRDTMIGLQGPTAASTEVYLKNTRAFPASFCTICRRLLTHSVLATPGKHQAASTSGDPTVSNAGAWRNVLSNLLL